MIRGATNGRGIGTGGVDIRESEEGDGGKRVMYRLEEKYRVLKRGKILDVLDFHNDGGGDTMVIG